MASEGITTAPKRDYLTPDPSLAPGSVHAGFEVVSATPVPEVSGTIYVLRHQASGARAMWISCADNNKSFSIAFKTPPADDTGVFHIIEHSVLCGSDAYPVKEPFVNLLKTSMQTFLNALTFPDKTMYPVASTNTADLENLMGVYLDAVLHPAIYHRRRIFEQEGWHLEAADDGSLSYNGVVFNEMKGAISDPDEVLDLALSRALFPQSPYRFESGGAPRAIPTLTYEGFLDAHARHYALPNSYTILYGDMDIDRELAFIDKRFRGAENRQAGAPNPLPLQPAVTAAPVRVEMATAPDNASVGLAYVVATSNQRTRVLAVDVLLDALCGSNEAPLKRRVLDAGLANDFQAVLVDGVAQPEVVFLLKGAHADVANRFRKLIEDSCREFAENGIPRDKLEASLAQAEFNLRERDFGSWATDGVALSMQALSSWLYDDDHPFYYLRYEEALAVLKKGLENNMFEDLLKQIVCENPHSALAELVPTESGDAAEEAQELTQLRAQMSDEDVEAVRREVEALRAEQEAPDSPEALATLPTLTVADIEPARPDPKAKDVEAPLPCIAHELDTRHIDYVYHYFDLRRVGFAELPYVGVLTDLLGKLDTKLHTASDLDTLVETNLGNLGFGYETYGRDDDLSFARPMLVVSASALSEKVDALASIPQEVWAKTLYLDGSRMRDILTQRKVALEQYFVNSGHTAAAARATSYFSSASVASSHMGGIDYYLFLKRLLANWDRRLPALQEILPNLADRIFTADEVTVSFTGSADDRARFWELGGTLGLEEQGENVCEHRLQIPSPKVAREGFVIPSNVSFVARAAAPTAADAGTLGTWQVATRALSFDYLWNEVRVKGGAYGVGFSRTTEGIRRFWSFRDPNVASTLERYDGAAAWLAKWVPTDDELSGYIVSSVAAQDAPEKPRALARRQDAQRFNGRPANWRNIIRQQELDTTADAVRALAPALEPNSASAGVCVFGPREAIEASGLDLDARELVGSEEA